MSSSGSLPDELDSDHSEEGELGMNEEGELDFDDEMASEGGESEVSDEQVKRRESTAVEED